MTPVLYRVVGRQDETHDITTLSLAPVADPPMAFRPGQFNMLTAFGVGEAAISVSSAPRSSGPLEHTVRDVGSVTHSLCTTEVGGLVGVRGPFGTPWDIGHAVRPIEHGHLLPGRESRPTTEGHGDTLVIAGGIGLAPLRGAVEELIALRQAARGRVFIIVGARDPSQIVFGDDLTRWAQSGAEVAVTVDVSAQGWTGHVGLVTSLLDDAGFNPTEAIAFVCGPEIMMRFTARTLIDRGVDPRRIQVSMERNMQCGIAWCGHCQLGPFLLCRDGPVLPYAGAVAHLLTERER